MYCAGSGSFSGVGPVTGWRQSPQVFVLALVETLLSPPDSHTPSRPVPLHLPRRLTSSRLVLIQMQQPGNTEGVHRLHVLTVCASRRM